jgi:hypothetical protein
MSTKSSTYPSIYLGRGREKIGVEFLWKGVVVDHFIKGQGSSPCMVHECLRTEQVAGYQQTHPWLTEPTDAGAAVVPMLASESIIKC